MNVKRSGGRMNCITRHAMFMQLYTFDPPLQSSLHAPVSFPLVHCTVLIVFWYDFCLSFFTLLEMLCPFLKPCRDNCFVGVPSGCYSHLSSHFPVASFFRLLLSCTNFNLHHPSLLISENNIVFCYRAGQMHWKDVLMEVVHALVYCNYVYKKFFLRY